jgi:predicted SAM-dependent methyltransferase
VGIPVHFGAVFANRRDRRPGLSSTMTAPTTPPATAKREPLRLHIGGEEVKAGWKILNAQPKPGVDFVGNCMDLSQFADNSVTEVYGSHVYEHLDYKDELLHALREAYRVLVPGGLFRAGVPDMDTLCKLFLDKRLDVNQRYHVMRMMYGGHIDDYDYHYVGLSEELFGQFLMEAKFNHIRRVPDFGLFQDTTTLTFLGVPISLNIMAVK